jgi:mono/diheme cytochrome c family protein
VKNQGKKLMSFRAFSIGFSAALLALACGSDDGNNPDGPIDVPEPPSGEDFCDRNPLAEDCTDGNQVPNETGNPPEETEEPPPEEIDDPGALELAAVTNILAENCGECHGPALTEAAARAGMNYITDLDRLAEEGKLRPLDSANSLIIQYMRDGVMPPGGADKVPTADINRVADYIDNPDYWENPDGPIGDCTETNGQFDFDQLFEAIDEDLSGEDADDQVNYRYLTLTNRFNAGVCADVSLDRDRQALVKMVNMLSTAATIEVPLQVDDDGLIYRIDLRDYDWNRAISVNGENFVDVWEAIVANNPYAVPFEGDVADDVVADTGTAVPFMYADSVNDVATIGNLYYAIIDVDVNQNLDDFVLNVLGINQDQNLLDEELIRAGTSDSRLSRQDMVAERHDIEVRAGAYWQRFDFADDQNESIFQDPFGFQEAGREAIFTLENGLFGYIIADDQGVILEDSDILLDFNQNNFRVVAGQSCSQCHNNGLIAFEDQVREFTLDNAVGLQLDNDEVEAIEEVYPSSQEFASIIARDTEQFYQRALESADLPVSGPDPVSRVFQRYDLDLEINDVAGDLGFTPDQLGRDIRELNEAVQVIDQPGGSIDRDDWTQFFVNSLCILTVAQENAPLQDVCDQAELDVEALGL